MIGTSMTKLLQLMAALRAPEDGCPWDLEQTYESLVSHTLEEAYEVVDCIERADHNALVGELGDLLFQVVFYAQIGKEQGKFDFDDVVASISAKLIARHPHVFADEAQLSAAQQSQRWEDMKAQERQNQLGEDVSALADVPVNLPALVRAQKLQKRAARVGFDWPSIDGVRAKVIEEIAELEQAQAQGTPADVEEEFGDLLFSCVNWARYQGLDAETVLRKATSKFESRFRALEEQIREEGLEIESQPLEELEARWQAVKVRQKKRAPKHP